MRVRRIYLLPCISYIMRWHLFCSDLQNKGSRIFYHLPQSLTKRQYSNKTPLGNQKKLSNRKIQKIFKGLPMQGTKKWRILTIFRSKTQQHSATRAKKRMRSKDMEEILQFFHSKHMHIDSAIPNLDIQVYVRKILSSYLLKYCACGRWRIYHVLHFWKSLSASRTFSVVLL